MDLNELRTHLVASTAEGRLDRGENRNLRRLIAEWSPGENELSAARHLVFEEGRRLVSVHGVDAAFEWVEKTLKAMILPPQVGGSRIEALFSPGENCRGRIKHLIDISTRSIDVCVYTITDDDLSRALMKAHLDREVGVRIITEDTKIDAPGSDIESFRAVGIPVAQDSAH